MQMNTPEAQVRGVTFSLGQKRWLSAIAIGCVLGLADQRVPSGAGFALWLLVAAILGTWTAKTRVDSVLWHGSALMFLAAVTAGLVSLAIMYGSSPMKQPDVLPPTPLLVVGGPLVIGIGWGAVGGAVAWAARLLLAK